MNEYIVMFNLTDTGIKEIKESLNRGERVKKFLDAHGTSMKEYWLTMGEYDVVALFEAPDDMTMAKMMLEIGGRIGAVRTKTMPAFGKEKYAELLASLS